MLNLNEYCSDFVKWKQVAGVKYKKQESILRRFIKHCEGFVLDNDTISKDVILTWNQIGPNESTANQRIRVNTVRNFMKYLISHGVSAYLSEPIKYKPSNFTPYIFSNDELSKFFIAVDNCGEKSVSNYRHLVMPVIFRLLYSCGLRLSEAINLKVGDVDLETGILTIIQTKFYKDRLIPVDVTLLERLRSYSKQVLVFSKSHDPFFPTSNNKFYSTSSIYYAFRDFLWKAGISHGGKGKGPRVHDFRHTFAVHCLRNWVISEKDLSLALPYLSTYMGHEGISYTQVYLRLTADLYPNIVKTMERNFDVLPELGGYYETN